MLLLSTFILTVPILANGHRGCTPGKSRCSDDPKDHYIYVCEDDRKWHQSTLCPTTGCVGGGVTGQFGLGFGLGVLVVHLEILGHRFHIR